MCDGIRYGDTTICGPCGLQWDTGDPDPPACRQTRPRGRPIAAEPPPVPPRIPGVLAPAVAADMARTYETRASSGGSPTAAMQAAYRVFLDSLE